MTVFSIAPIDSEPLLSDFIPLKEYQSYTPAIFSLEENPVLHTAATFLPLEAPQLYRLPRTYSESRFKSKRNNNGKEYDENQYVSELKLRSEGKGPEGPILVNVIISSARLYLWFPQEADNFGYAIPYTSITLHGITNSKVLYLQVAVPNEILSSNADSPDNSNVISNDGKEYVEFWINAKVPELCNELYGALSNCANLHMDPDMSDQEGENQTGSFFGTDDNMDFELEVPDSFTDENGEFLVSNTGTADDLEDEMISDIADESCDMVKPNKIQGSNGMLAKNGEQEASLEIKLEQSKPTSGIRRTREDLDSDEENSAIHKENSTSNDNDDFNAKWRKVL